ncbi:MAG: alkaline phosphatase [Bacteroidaceae bacterium]|nr:alkaline phosphatase [Bacteroidaceae bacterium]
MLKKSISFLLFLCLTLATFAAGQAKYVFYFIGDGMGVNQVNGTQTFLAALQGRIGIQPLCFTSFPYAALITTYSGTNGVTDSAAAGTALATGHKTMNHALGVLADGETPIQSIAAGAKQAGAAVGVTTSVSVDHATPAAFYAHQAERSWYYRVGQDLIKAGFDFYAGSDFVDANGGKDEPSLYEQCAGAGYTILRGYSDFCAAMGGKGAKQQKMILLQPEEASKRDRKSLPYAIDRDPESDLSLKQITQAGIQYLGKRAGKEGFFLMVEGGKIDFACHSNDAATVFREVMDMDGAIREALEFYKAHPDETLIVVTADHETGGIVLGRGPYELHTDLLQYQQMSVEAYSVHVGKLCKEQGEALTWETVEADLRANWGFGEGVKLSEKQWKRLRSDFESMQSGAAMDANSLYASVNRLADSARAIMAECALIGWQSGGHSNGYVPVFAIGVGAENFHGQMDNTQISRVISKATGWKLSE